MSVRKRSLKMEKVARIYDAEILPVWSERFGRMLLRGLEFPAKGQVLDVACGTGYPAMEILRRTSEGCRLIAIDASSAMLDVARKKVQETGRKGVFFRTESASSRLSFADDVYDVVVCNLGISEMGGMPEVVSEFVRVTTTGGEMRCTLPLEGTFQEFYDIYREVLIKHDKHDALDRLNDHVKATYPSAELCERWLARTPLADYHVEVEEFSMLFRSSREFFFAPVIEYGPLSTWKAIAGDGQEMQDVFWYIKEAIDAYFGGRAFEVTVKAGCLMGTKGQVSDEDVTGRVQRLDEDTEPAPLGPAPTFEGSSNTEEIDIAELEQIEVVELSTDGLSEVELDAFSEGKPRPVHLEFVDDE